jgi:glutamine amidotransferase-like uncharacterized protein
MPKKVFIYQDSNTAYLSIPDLKELLSTTEIFSSAPDISIGSFNFNMDGLINPLFVIPGGSAICMGAEVLKQMNAIRSAMGEKYDFLGICAGGFLATESADLFQTPFKRSSDVEMLIPQWLGSFAEHNLDINSYAYSLKLFPDYKSVGPFYPNDSQMHFDTAKTYVPHRVSLLVPGSQRRLEQLYMLGPAFVPTGCAGEKSEVVATYPDENYMFRYGRGDHRFFRKPAAILAKPATDKHGARLISSTHIETCVKGSKLLAACNEDSAINIALPEDDYRKLITQQEETQTEVVSLLKRTFNR